VHGFISLNLRWTDVDFAKLNHIPTHT